MEIFGEYDVIAVGGGTSGVAAAISAARVGASTLVIERLGALGGQMNISVLRAFPTLTCSIRDMSRSLQDHRRNT